MLSEKPVKLMEFILQATNEGDTVLDPFMGSGTTGVACLKNKRRFIGIEVEEYFFDLAVKRLREVAR